MSNRPRPAYDWPGAARFAVIVAAMIASWMILAGIWHLILFLIRLVSK